MGPERRHIEPTVLCELSARCISTYPLTVLLPSGLSLMGTTPGASNISGQTITFVSGGLSAGQSRVFVVQVKATKAVITKQIALASVFSNGTTDPNAANNTASVTTAIK